MHIRNEEYVFSIVLIGTYHPNYQLIVRHEGTEKAFGVVENKNISNTLELDVINELNRYPDSKTEDLLNLPLVSKFCEVNKSLFNDNWEANFKKIINENRFGNRISKESQISQQNLFEEEIKNALKANNYILVKSLTDYLNESFKTGYESQRLDELASIQLGICNSRLEYYQSSHINYSNGNYSQAIVQLYLSINDMWTSILEKSDKNYKNRNDKRKFQFKLNTYKMLDPNYDFKSEALYYLNKLKSYKMLEYINKTRDVLSSFEGDKERFPLAPLMKYTLKISDNPLLSSTYTLTNACQSTLNIQGENVNPEFSKCFNNVKIPAKYNIIINGLNNFNMDFLEYLSDDDKKRYYLGIIISLSNNLTRSFEKNIYDYLIHNGLDTSLSIKRANSLGRMNVNDSFKVLSDLKLIRNMFSHKIVSTTESIQEICSSRNRTSSEKCLSDFCNYNKINMKQYLELLYSILDEFEKPNFEAFNQEILDQLLVTKVTQNQIEIRNQKETLVSVFGNNDPSSDGLLGPLLNSLYCLNKNRNDKINNCYYLLTGRALEFVNQNKYDIKKCLKSFDYCQFNFIVLNKASINMSEAIYDDIDKLPVYSNDYDIEMSISKAFELLAPVLNDLTERYQSVNFVTTSGLPNLTKAIQTLAVMYSNVELYTCKGSFYYDIDINKKQQSMARDLSENATIEIIPYYTEFYLMNIRHLLNRCIVRKDINALNYLSKNVSNISSILNDNDIESINTFSNMFYGNIKEGFTKYDDEDILSINQIVIFDFFISQNSYATYIRAFQPVFTAILKLLLKHKRIIVDETASKITFMYEGIERQLINSRDLFPIIKEICKNDILYDKIVYISNLQNLRNFIFEHKDDKNDLSDLLNFFNFKSNNPTNEEYKNCVTMAADVIKDILSMINKKDLYDKLYEIYQTKLDGLKKSVLYYYSWGETTA